MNLCTATLDLAYATYGPPSGPPVILLHGYPYAPDCFAVLGQALGAAGHRVIVPALRGFADTRLLSGAPRSGQQAAIAQDVLDLMEGLSIERAALAGFDWGGRAACIVAALQPHRVRALVAGGGYLIQNLSLAGTPLPPAAEHRHWYQHYFCTPRGAAALTADAGGFARYLWHLWSPHWDFSEDEFSCTARAFDNPDHVEIVLHSYRHRLGQAPGFPAYAEMEAALAATPAISVPTLALFGEADGVLLPQDDSRHFTGPYKRLVLPLVGHNPFQEAPDLCLDIVNAFLAAHA
jgi:pimeloyl-ACP methyl ester carboxylesterase